jgi:hypothetical protein
MNKEIAEKHRFKLLSAEDVMSLPDPTWIIDGVLPRESLAQFWGESGCYKSFITLDIALSVCTGLPWINQFPVKRRSKVVYVGAEGAPGYKKRIKAWLTDNSLTLADLRDSFRFLPESLPLDSELDCSVFLHKVKEFIGDDHIDLLIMDTQARCTEGVDENSSKEMGLILKRLDTFKRSLKTTVLLVHHSGLKEATRARGSGAVKAALDTQFSVRRIPRHDKAVQFKMDKQKDWEDNWTEDLLMVPVGDSLVISKGDKKVLNTMNMSWTSLSPKRRRVLSLLQYSYFNGEPDGLSYSEWHSQTEHILSKAGFIKALKTYKDLQLVELENEKYRPVAGLPTE